MMGKLRRAVAWILALIISILSSLLIYLSRKRRQAEEAAARKEQESLALRAVRDKETRAREAQQQSREESN